MLETEPLTFPGINYLNTPEDILETVNDLHNNRDIVNFFVYDLAGRLDPSGTWKEIADVLEQSDRDWAVRKRVIQHVESGRYFSLTYTQTNEGIEDTSSWQEVWPTEQTIQVFTPIEPGSVASEDDDNDWLWWFYCNANFGPATDDVVASMRAQYEEETGKKAPEE